MNLFVLLLALLSSLSANAQSIEVRLKAKILQIETEKATNGRLLLTDAQFASFQYRLIPIKDWWKMFYDIHKEFKTDMSRVLRASMADRQKRDSLNPIHQADSLAALLSRELPDTSVSKEEAYFKAKYENANPNQQVYEVWYELNYKSSGRAIQTRKLRKAFYQHDLSEVHSSN
ncbi:hypothetical protein BH09BAC4_BH09BAC4_11760 [soil metagenome]